MDQTQSQDNMSNAPIGGDLFAELKRAIEANVADKELSARLQASVDDMRALQGQTAFAEAYQKFVALSGGHVELVRPYLAPLTDQIGTARA